MESVPNIFDYSDYRAFLRDTFQHMKEAHRPKRYTYGAFAKLCGFENETSIRRVINGERNLTIEKLDQIASGLNLSNAESAHFRDLIRFNQSAKLEDAVQAFDRLSKRFQKHQFEKLDTTKGRILAKWQNVAIRELVATDGFRGDANWICDRLKGAVSRQEAESILEYLIHAGFVQREGERLVPADTDLYGGWALTQSVLDHYHLQGIQNAIKAISRNNPLEQEVHTATVAVSEEAFQEFRDEVRKLIKKLLVSSNQGEDRRHVAQLGIQFFKLTR